MKKFHKVIMVAMIMAGFSGSLMAQTNQAHTDAAANILTAIDLTEVSNLHFGTMTIPTGAVNITLSTGGIRTESVPGSITLLAQAPAAKVAAYTVSGSANATYAVTLPADGVVTVTDGVNTMNVNSFVAETNTGIGSTGSLDGSGAGTFNVGATLELLNAQPAGIYQGTFDIVVNYN